MEHSDDADLNDDGEAAKLWPVLDIAVERMEESIE